MSYPPEGFLPLIQPPTFWVPSADGVSDLQGYVCQPLPGAIGVLVTAGARFVIGEVVHVATSGVSAVDYLDGLRGLYIDDGNGSPHTTEVAIRFVPGSGYFVAMRADTNAISMEAALERVSALKRQAELRAETEAAKIAEAVATPTEEPPAPAAPEPATEAPAN